MDELSACLTALGLAQNEVEKVASIFSKKIILKKGDFFSKEGQTCKELGFIVKAITSIH
ncbi:hypothetical protein [Parafilimonas sp.]|uniref:hypothetical protein n=1 Tax=Parafilimonas sp. TaxID=1969739 RepID=UPI0039E2DB40